MQIVHMSYQVALGLEQAACTLVGRQIGKNNIPKAKQFYRSFQIFTSIAVGTTSVLVYVLKEHLVNIFTVDPTVVSTIVKVIWVISFSNFPDGYKGMLKGVIRALGLLT